MSYALYVLIAVAALVVSAAGVIFLRTARLKRIRTEPVYPRAADSEVCRRAAENLAELIRFKTVFCEAQGKYGEWVRLRDHLVRCYPLSHATMKREVVGRYSLLYHWSSDKPEGDPLLFCGHLDVAPAGENWKHPPFEGKVDNEYVWGRGALDGKQVVTCLLETAESLIASGFIPKRDIYFAFVHDEVTGGEEGADDMARLFARRNLHFEMVLDQGGLLKRGVLSLLRPVAEVGVAEKGAVSVRLTAQRECGYVSEPPRRTAVGAVSEAVCRVEFKPPPAHVTPLTYDFLKMLAPYLSFGWRMRVANRWLLARRLAAVEPSWVRSIMTPMTLSAGDASGVLPVKAEAMLDVWLRHGETTEDALRYLRDLFVGLDISVMALSNREAGKVSDYSGRTFETVAEVVRMVFGPVPVIPALSVQSVGARKYEPFSDCVYRFMPLALNQEELDGMKGKDERVSVDGLGLAIAFYGRMITHMAG